jgi:hypothetical protein
MKTIMMVLLLGGVARADLGDAHAISIGDGIGFGASKIGSQNGFAFSPSLDWFPVRGLSIGANVGVGAFWFDGMPATVELNAGVRVGYAFHLPDRWTIWPRLGYERYLASTEFLGDQVTADALIAKAIGGHVYVGLRPEVSKPSFTDFPFFTVRAVIGATF